MKNVLHSRGHFDLRRGRVSIPGQVYLITVVCTGRKKWFAEWNQAAAASAAIAERRLWRDSKLLSWVLMPDHLHLLVELGGSEPLPKLMQRVKAISARAVNRLLRRKGAVWMHAYHERALREEGDVLVAARYIVANPIRAKLTMSIGGYPFWDAVWLARAPEVL